MADLRDDLQRAREHNNNLHNIIRRVKSSEKRSREELAELKQEHKQLQYNFEYVSNKLLEPCAKQKNFDWDRYDGEALDSILTKFLRDAVEANSLRRELRAYQDEQLKSNSTGEEVHALQEQVQMLQQELFAKVEKGRAVSDEQFATAFRILAASIKSLSRAMRFDGATNVTDVLRPLGLLLDVPSHHWQDRAGKKSYVEMWVWSILLHFVFENPFAVFNSYSKVANKAWTQIYGIDHFQGWPRSTASSELWRCTTVESLTESVGRDVIVRGKTDVPEEGVEASVIETRILVSNAIETMLESACVKSDFSQLQSIVDNAFELALEMSLQKFRIQITFPEVGADFDEHKMLLLPDQDGEDISGAIVAFVVNPGLTKWGDADGKNLDQRFDIVPALVQMELMHPEGCEFDMHQAESLQEMLPQESAEEVKAETTVVKTEEIEVKFEMEVD